MASIFTSDEAVIIQANNYLKGFALEAIVTSFLILFIAILAFVIYILKTRTYIPRKDELSIEFYD